MGDITFVVIYAVKTLIQSKSLPLKARYLPLPFTLAQFTENLLKKSILVLMPIKPCCLGKDMIAFQKLR